MKVFADYHTHTRHSHGTGSVMENVAAARKRGLEQIAISDHGPANLFGIGVNSLRDFRQIKEEIAAARTRYPGIAVLLGVEANIIDDNGTLDIPIRMLPEFDVVLAGLHVLVHPGSISAAFGLIIPNMAGRWLPRLRPGMRRRNTAAVVNAVLRNPIDIITHPGLHIDIDTSELARVCARKGTALEINSRHHHTTAGYIRAAAAKGAQFAFGSDAHSPDRVGDFAAGITLAKEAGLTPDKIVNAR